MRQDCIKITCDNCGEEIVVMTYNGEPDASQAKKLEFKWAQLYGN